MGVEKSEPRGDNQAEKSPEAANNSGVRLDQVPHYSDPPTIEFEGEPSRRLEAPANQAAEPPCPADGPFAETMRNLPIDDPGRADAAASDETEMSSVTPIEGAARPVDAAPEPGAQADLTGHTDRTPDSRDRPAETGGGAAPDQGVEDAGPDLAAVELESLSEDYLATIRARERLAQDKDGAETRDFGLHVAGLLTEIADSKQIWNALAAFPSGHSGLQDRDRLRLDMLLNVEFKPILERLPHFKTDWLDGVEVALDLNKQIDRALAGDAHADVASIRGNVRRLADYVRTASIDRTVPVDRLHPLLRLALEVAKEALAFFRIVVDKELAPRLAASIDPSSVGSWEASRPNSSSPTYC